MSSTPAVLPAAIFDIRGYLESEGAACPFCKGTHLDLGESDFTEKFAWRRITCRACGESWDDQYELTGVDYAGQSFIAPNPLTQKLMDAISHVLNASEDGGSFSDVNFSLLREALSEAETAFGTNTAADGDEPPVSTGIHHVRASVQSDDGTVSAEFEADRFLEQADESAIRELIRCGLGNDYSADDVALFFEDEDDSVRAVINHGNYHSGMRGYEVKVDEPSFSLWLSAHRPDIARSLTESELDAIPSIKPLLSQCHNPVKELS